MKTLKYLWKLIDGNKTIIGLAGTAFLQLDLNCFNKEADWYIVAVWFFGLLAAGGFIHHVAKGKLSTKNS